MTLYQTLCGGQGQVSLARFSLSHVICSLFFYGMLPPLPDCLCHLSVAISCLEDGAISGKLWDYASMDIPPVVHNDLN